MVVMGGQESCIYSYDICINGKGLLCCISGIIGGVIQSWLMFVYFFEGWFILWQDVVQGVVDIIGYSYDSMGCFIGISYLSGVVVGYVYDYGKLVVIMFIVGGVMIVIVNGFCYQFFGVVLEWIYGNGLKCSVVFDMEGCLVSFIVSNVVIIL